MRTEHDMGTTTNGVNHMVDGNIVHGYGLEVTTVE